MVRKEGVEIETDLPWVGNYCSLVVSTSGYIIFFQMTLNIFEIFHNSIKGFKKKILWQNLKIKPSSGRGICHTYNSQITHIQIKICWWECKLMQSLWKIFCHYLLKVKMWIYDSGIPLLICICQRCTNLLMIALFISNQKLGNNIHNDENE